MHGSLALAIPLVGALVLAAVVDLSYMSRKWLANRRPRRYGKSHDD